MPSLRDAIKDSISRLQGFEDATLEAWIFLEFVTQSSRATLLSDMERYLTPQELLRLNQCIEKRLTHMPLEYILGTVEFRGHQYLIEEGVLVPRPETELLVEFAAKYIQDTKIDPNQLLILECGFGSGVISIELAMMFPKSRIKAWDISARAYDLASKNLKQFSIGNIDLYCADFFDSKFGVMAHIDQTKDILIVSNPPYIPFNEIATLDQNVRDFEPHDALTDYEDGFTFYKQLLHLKEGIQASLIVECGLGQAQFIQSFTQGESMIQKDYQGIDRIILFSS